MNITQSGNILTITSIETSSYTYIHVLQKVSTTDTIIYDYEFTDSFSTYTLAVDGYFIISEIKLPITPGYGYYISNNTIFDSDNNTVSIQELLDLEILDTNIVREDINYFSTNIINSYYINYIQSNYVNNLCSGKLLSSQDKITIDSLTMGLSIIQCLIECGEQYYEAQRIIEKLSLCTGIINTNCNCNG